MGPGTKSQLASTKSLTHVTPIVSSPCDPNISESRVGGHKMLEQHVGRNPAPSTSCTMCPSVTADMCMHACKFVDWSNGFGHAWETCWQELSTSCICTMCRCHSRHMHACMQGCRLEQWLWPCLRNMLAGTVHKLHMYNVQVSQQTYACMPARL